MISKINTFNKDERGFSLTEILVAIGLLAVVSTVVVAAVLSTGKASQGTTDAAMTQQQLLDATARVTKEIATATKFVTAADRQVTFQTASEEVTYLAYDPAVGAGAVSVDSALLPSTPAIVEVRAKLDSLTNKTVTSLVTGLVFTDKPVFQYFDKTKLEPMAPTPIVEGKLSEIERVSLRFSSFVEGRDVPMELVTSITPRVILGLGDDTGNVFGETSESVLPPSITLYGDLPERSAVANLTWTEIDNAANYVLYRHNINTGAVDAVYSGIATTFANSGLTRGHTYAYYVVGTDLTNKTVTSNTVNLVTSPPAPTITVTASGLTNTISWSPVAGATSYKVYRVTVGTPLATVTTTSYAHTNSSHTGVPYYGQVNYYYVVALNAQGSASENSNTGTAISPPAAPVVYGHHENGMRFALYNGVDNATKYELKRVSPDPYTWLGSHTYRGGYDAATIDSDTFTYQARGGNDAGWGPWSNVLTLNPRPAAPVLRGWHENGARTAIYDGVANANVYQLERISPSYTLWQGDANYRGGYDGAAIDADTFTYRARAGNTLVGWGPWSNVLTLYPRPAAPNLTGYDYDDGWDGSNHFVWNHVPNGSYYEWSRNWGTGWNATQSDRATDSSPGYDSAYNYYIRACNITGCGANNYVTLKQRPGPFAYTGAWQARRADFSETRGKTFEAFSVEREWAYATFAWSGSSGADAYELNSNGDMGRTSFEFAPISGKGYTLTAKAKGYSSGLTREVNLHFWSTPATVSKFVITPQTDSAGLNTQFLYSSADAAWKKLASDSGEGSYQIQRKAWATDVVNGNWNFTSQFDFTGWTGAEVDSSNYSKADIKGARTSVGAAAATRTEKGIPSGHTPGTIGSQRGSNFIANSGVFTTAGNFSSVLWFTHATAKAEKWGGALPSSGWGDIKYTVGNYPDGRPSGTGYVVVSN